MWVISYIYDLRFSYSKKETHPVFFPVFGDILEFSPHFIFQAPHTIIKVKAHDSQ